MSFFGSMDVSASGLSMNRLRLDLISQNIANAETTKTAEGTPYRKKSLIVREKQVGKQDFSNILRDRMQGNSNIEGSERLGRGVETVKIVEDQSAFKRIYEPDNPEADEDGYVSKPNVNIVEEMVNMISASRSYEANVTAMDANKAMAQKALELGK